MNEMPSQDLQSSIEDEERKGLRWSSNNMMVFVPFQPPEEEEIERIEEIFAVAA